MSAQALQIARTTPSLRENMPNRVARRPLRGRSSECEALDRLLVSVQAGHSRALVMRGEAGVGKTALLEYLLSGSSGCQVARAVGVESEMELAFAGLHQLCAPFLDRLERLPVPQRDSLRTAFGLNTGQPPDRFLVGLAALGLLSEVAEDRPLLCIVDDAQWQDRASAEAFAFVARRVQAQSVGLVFAVRGRGEGQEMAGLPELVVRGLSDDDARALLDSVMPGRLDACVRDRIVAETRGNPLALLELPRGLTPAELAGGFGLACPRPLVNRIEHSFVGRVESLPSDTQQLLLLAAAEPVGDVPLLWRAARLLGIGVEAAAPAETAGLIDFGARVRFRHPLVRSAVYRAAAVHDRQRAHRALGEASHPESDPDRRAWHRAQAAASPDEAVAIELERSAGRALARGGAAAAAAFLERSVELTPDPTRRAARALAAARAKLDAAAPQAASELLGAAAIGPLDELQRARLERLHAQVRFAQNRGSDAPPLLLKAAERLGPLDRKLARETYLDALAAAIFAGRLSGNCGLREVAGAARAVCPAPSASNAVDLLLGGLTTRFTSGYSEAVLPLRRALDAFADEEGAGQDSMRWLWLACRVAPELWDDRVWNQLTARAVTLARDAASLTLLPIALTYRAGVEVHAGQFTAAAALIEEAQAIVEATREPALLYTSLVLPAWRGREDEALESLDAGIRDANARGEGRVIALAECFRAVLYNGLGRYQPALVAAQRACESDDLGLHAWALIELVEASTRSDARGVACDALRRLEERTQASGTDWALGILARSRALLSEGEDAESLYREAIERLARTRIAVHLARAHLVYGEWLRREHRRVDAREQLRAAHEMFSGMGAEAFAERARRELSATGEIVRKRTVETLDELTTQEAQIARLAGDGQSNPEIAAELFISARTVEYHLRKVFGKLDISSRKELRGAFPDTKHSVVAS